MRSTRDLQLEVHAAIPHAHKLDYASKNTWVLNVIVITIIVTPGVKDQHGAIWLNPRGACTN